MDIDDYSPENIERFAIGMGLSNFNGLMALALSLARRGLLREDDASFLRSQLLKPFNLSQGAGVRLFTEHQARIDGLMEELVQRIQSHPDNPQAPGEKNG